MEKKKKKEKGVKKRGGANTKSTSRISRTGPLTSAENGREQKRKKEISGKVEADASITCSKPKRGGGSKRVGDVKNMKKKTRKFRS